MNPEVKHLEAMREWALNDVKNSKCMADHTFVIERKNFFLELLTFTVSVNIDHDDDWVYDEVIDLCKNYVEDMETLNNSSYKTIADDLYLFLATQAPGRKITIKISNPSLNGVTIKYNQK